jgi:hypothetical protein
MSATLVLLVTLAPAQPALDACALLKATEVGPAIGGTGAPHNSDMVIPSGPAKGQTMHMCSWTNEKGGMLSVAAIRVTADSKEAGMALIERVYATLKAQGWTEKSQAIAGGKCSVMTPPATLKDTPVTTGCFAEAKGMGVAVGSMGATRVPIEKVKPLLNKAIKRLP